MTNKVLPKEYNILRILHPDAFKRFGSLEELMMQFPFSGRKNLDFVKEELEMKRCLLWAVQSDDKKAVGYILCNPNYPHYNSESKTGFYIIERFVDPEHRRKGVCFMMVFIATNYAKKEFRKRCAFEEVSLWNNEGIITSHKLGFYEIGQEKRGNEIYSIRKKSLIR